MKITGLRVHAIFHGINQSGALVTRTPAKTLRLLRAGIPEPLRPKFDKEAADPGRLSSYEDPALLGKYEGCQLAIIGGGLGYLLLIQPSRGKWELAEAIAAEGKMTGLKELAPEFFVSADIDGHLKERAYRLQRENWRMENHWSSRLGELS